MTNEAVLGDAPTSINPQETLNVRALTSIDPYETLNVSEDATPAQIKRAFHRVALKHHPDKAVDKVGHTIGAHARFQEVVFAYAVLSDSRRRERYDATFRTEDCLGLDGDDFDWPSFYREHHASAVTPRTIQAFSASYKGSDRERTDLLAAYTYHKGKMSLVHRMVRLSDVRKDDRRFRGIIDAAIALGEVEAFDAYENETPKSEKGRGGVFKRGKEVKKFYGFKDLEADKNNGKPSQQRARPTQCRRKQSRARAVKGADMTMNMGDLAAGRAAFLDALQAKPAPDGDRGSKTAAKIDPSED